MNKRILDIYASISAKSEDMLGAAKASDWDRLILLEQDCRTLIESLKGTDTGTDAGVGAGARFMQCKVAFIRKVLADDAEIRKFTEPWMTKLETYLGNARQEHKLRSAYDTELGA